ncbi:MAG: HipA N-terminal domain-containing protein [Agriterribacter sp.]
MAQGAVYYNGMLAGYLKKPAPGDYRFIYTDAYMNDPLLPSISLTLPKKKREHQSPVLFSFFAGLLSEGINKEIQCRKKLFNGVKVPPLLSFRTPAVDNLAEYQQKTKRFSISGVQLKYSLKVASV